MGSGHDTGDTLGESLPLSAGLATIVTGAMALFTLPSPRICDRGLCPLGLDCKGCSGGGVVAASFSSGIGGQ